MRPRRTGYPFSFAGRADWPHGLPASRPPIPGSVFHPSGECARLRMPVLIAPTCRGMASMRPGECVTTTAGPVTSTRPEDGCFLRAGSCSRCRPAASSLSPAHLLTYNFTMYGSKINLSRIKNFQQHHHRPQRRLCYLFTTSTKDTTSTRV